LAKIAREEERNKERTTKDGSYMHQIRISKALILLTRKRAFLGSPEF
jgi:hypothetical protein